MGGVRGHAGADTGHSRGHHRSRSITYGGARPGGEYGLAIARAEWHRTFVTARSVEMVTPRTIHVPIREPNVWAVDDW